jgi:DNA modification methylase
MILRIQNEFWGNLKDIFIWRKQAVSNITAKQGGMAKGWEYVFMFGENNKSTFEYNNFPSNGYVPNIQEFYKEEFFSNHHATFPKKLAGYFIRYFTKENDLVLDIFNGVGTTTAACEQWNRRWIGIDIIPEYCEIARKRIAEEKDKMALFNEM